MKANSTIRVLGVLGILVLLLALIFTLSTGSTTISAGAPGGPLDVVPAASGTPPNYPPPATATTQPQATPTVPRQPTVRPDEPGASPPAPTPTPVPPGVVVSQITPGQGGVIDAYMENVRITFPPGMVDFPVTFVYQVAPPPTGSQGLAGSRLYFNLEARMPSGDKITQFKKSFEICAKGATGISYFDGKNWIDIPVTPTADGVCGRLDHLTLFAVVVVPTPTPAPGGAPGVAGPGPGTAAQVTATAPAAPSPAASPAAPTPSVVTTPARLPATGGGSPWLALLGIALAALALGLFLRRTARA